MIDPVADALLPPAILAILAVAFFLARRRRLTIVALVALILLSVEGVPHLLVTPLLLTESAPETLSPKAIVVLASGSPEWLDPSRTVPSLETLKSLRTAASVYRRTGLPVLVSGARAPDGRASGDASIADGMALSLDADFAVPTAWREAASTNVWQSAAAVASVMRGMEIEGIYLIGQPWEMRLGVSVFRAAGLRVVPVSVPYRRQRTLDLTALVAFTPAWLESAVAIREWAGLACQAMPLCVAWMRG